LPLETAAKPFGAGHRIPEGGHRACDDRIERGEDVSETNRVFMMFDMVQYQPGAVVSREVIQRPHGTVTVFAFDSGEGLSEHTAPFDALVLDLDGDVEITVAGEPHRLSAGQAIIMPAGKPHSLKALSPFKMMLVMIRE
jgi:quercetin dioxygenase-like cupin family protein